MACIDPTKEFFCPEPWKGMYIRLNNTSPCHTNLLNEGLSPEEYLKSDSLRKIKEDFMAGKVPPSCRICKEREDLGIHSTRLSIFTHPDGKSTLEFNKEDFSVDRPTVVGRLELRTSNLCNFKCRMCNASNSSEIARENMEYPMLREYDTSKEDAVVFTTESSLEELKNIALDSVHTLCLTGGEPLLIKQYYDFLDLFIERGLSKNIRVTLFTNCSVYNPKFIERLEKFKKVRFIMSIDGVEKTAEYQRKGTVWSTVESNAYKFIKLKKPFQLYVNTTISPYVLLDASSLAHFLMKLYDMNNELEMKCYATVSPQGLHIMNMDKESRRRAVEQIDKAVEILKPDNFHNLRREFLDIRKNLVDSEPAVPSLFIAYTNILDKIRNEKFEDVFGYKLV
jgi:sulfatase maturation enzyme AslB (radical SAM superfamily)